MSYSADEQYISFTIDNIFRKYDLNKSAKLEANEIAVLLEDANRVIGSEEQAIKEKWNFL